MFGERWNNKKQTKNDDDQECAPGCARDVWIVSKWIVKST